MAIVEINGYACLVPYVDDEEGVFFEGNYSEPKGDEEIFERIK